MTDQLPADVECLERIRGELSEASYPRVREVRDKAEAVLHYLRRVGVAGEVQHRVAEIKVRAERRLGDLLSMMSRRGPGQYKRGAGETSLDDTDEGLPPTLSELGVSRNQSSRWQLIASVPKDLFESYVAKSKGSDALLSSAGVLRLARELKANATALGPGQIDDDARVVSDLDGLLESKEQFGCIYADPPWQYKNQGTRGATKNHYPTMPLNDIASLPVAELALPDAHLHLWVTSSFLHDAESIIRSWGFEPKSSFVWVKPTMGLGNYWRCAHELLLLGVRGSLKFRDHSIRSWIREPRTKHSKKPEIVRTLVERVSPGPYLELFGRRAEVGWTVFGNQVELPSPRRATHGGMIRENPEVRPGEGGSAPPNSI